MARDMRTADDFGDVSAADLIKASGNVPATRDSGPNDTKAQHEAATQLAYSVHGANCTQCGRAQSENDLCNIGRRLYQGMRDAGVVG